MKEKKLTTNLYAEWDKPPWTQNQAHVPFLHLTPTFLPKLERVVFSTPPLSLLYPFKSLPISVIKFLRLDTSYQSLISFYNPFYITCFFKKKIARKALLYEIVTQGYLISFML